MLSRRPLILAVAVLAVAVLLACGEDSDTEISGRTVEQLSPAAPQATPVNEQQATPGARAPTLPAASLEGLPRLERGPPGIAIPTAPPAAPVAPPAGPPPSSADEFQDHLVRGSRFLGDGDLSGASAEFRAAARADPQDPRSYLGLALAALASDELDRALAEAHRAVELGPRLPAAWATRGDVRRAIGDLDTAIADYDAALALEPGLASAHAGRGLALAASGDVPGSIAALSHARSSSSETVRSSCCSARSSTRSMARTAKRLST
jgi:tetratricopeptide (TPR) repeat protein